ncbi:anaerobic sulfatase maturase [candidate division KSB1 bacterium]
MIKASREFQVFVKPTGSICNLDCSYCYYLEKENLYPEADSFRMSEGVLEEYIKQHIEIYPGAIIRFSWHGGEPTILGLDYFRNIIRIQKKYKPDGKYIYNGIQTNGILLDEEWCRFLMDEGFFVGISIDGPKGLHDKYRVSKGNRSSFEQTMRGYGLLKEYGINRDLLCVVNAQNVQYPKEVYNYFREIGAEYITFLPLVEYYPNVENGVSVRTVPADLLGKFLCTVFDEWIEHDIGKIKIQIFEEAARTAFGQDHSLCIFRKTCGDVPVVEHNGDFYSCDHYVNQEHLLGNITERQLAEMIEDQQQRAFGNVKLNTLPRYCRECFVLDMCNGECPKNRFIKTPDGEVGLNYLCAGYKMFFKHCEPFITELSSVWRNTAQDQRTLQPDGDTGRFISRTRRNDPCPCGSGKKYKHCCLGK